MDELRLKLGTIVAERLNVSQEDLAGIDKLTDYGDSLGFMDLLSDIEEAFNIHISNAELDAMESFEDLVGVVRRAQGAACATS